MSDFIDLPCCSGGSAGGSTDAITALTGDASAAGPGNVPITLTTVNQNPGTFGSSGTVGVFTVNAKGLIVSSSAININAGGASGITSLSGDGSASGPGAATFTLSSVNANIGTFGSASSVAANTVNAKGLVTASSSFPILIAESQVTNLVADLAAKASSGAYLTALTGDATASGPGSATLTLATVNANTGTFGSASSVAAHTVNAKGLVTASSSFPILIAESQVTNLVADLAAKASSGAYLTALTGDATASGPGSAALTFATVNATTGTFGSASSVAANTVNAKGLVTSTSAFPILIAESQVTNLVADLAAKASSGAYLTALTGDATASGPGSAALTFATVNATSGTFGSSTAIPVFTVNAKGLITASTSVAALSSNAITALTGDATASGPGSVSLTLSTVNGVPGTFGSASQVGQLTVNAKGLVTASTAIPIQISEAQVTNLIQDLANKASTGNYVTALTGDGTATGPGSATLTLATVNATTGTFGSTGTVGAFTVNSKGLITASTSYSIVSGITQLTGDVVAGPGNGSQAATVNKVGVYASSSVVQATSAALGATSANVIGSIVSRGFDPKFSNTNFSVDAIYSTSGTFNNSVDVLRRSLINSSSAVTVDYQNSILKYSNTNPAVSWGSSKLQDTSGKNSIDWNARALLFNSSTGVAVDWQATSLKTTTNLTALDWNLRTLYDGGNLNSLDWAQRTLTNNNSQIVATWNTSTLQKTSGAQSIDWENQYLQSGPVGNIIFNWGSNLINDSSGNNSIDPQNRTLVSNSPAASNISASWSANGISTIGLSSTGALVSTTGGAGAGVGAVTSSTGFGNMAGRISLVTGSGTLPNSTAVLVTLPNPTNYVLGQKIFLSPANAFAAALFGTRSVWAQGASSGSFFNILTNSSALGVSTQYVWNYLVVG